MLAANEEQRAFEPRVWSALLSVSLQIHKKYETCSCWRICIYPFPTQFIVCKWQHEKWKEKKFLAHAVLQSKRGEPVKKNVEPSQSQA